MQAWGHAEADQRFALDRRNAVSPSQNDPKESGNQSNAAVLSAWMHLVNIVLRGLYIHLCIKTLTYVHKDTTYNFAPYTKKRMRRRKEQKPEGKKQFCFYSICFQIFLRIFHNSMLLMLENYWLFLSPLGDIHWPRRYLQVKLFRTVTVTKFELESEFTILRFF